MNIPIANKTFWKNTLRLWLDHAPIRSAALSFYTLFSIGPLFIVFSYVVSLISDYPQSLIYDQLAFVLDPFLLKALQSISTQAELPPLLGIVGLFILLYIIMRLFTHIYDSINGVFDCKVSGWKTMLIKRGWAILLVLIGGFVILALSSIHALIAGLTVSNLIMISLIIVLGTLTLTVMYRSFPDTDIAWKHAFLGAVISSVLLAIGNQLYGWIIHWLNVSLYGIAGSLILLLLWIYYAAHIFFFGVAFTATLTTQGSG